MLLLLVWIPRARAQLATRIPSTVKSFKFITGNSAPLKHTMPKYNGAKTMLLPALHSRGSGEVSHDGRHGGNDVRNSQGKPTHPSLPRGHNTNFRGYHYRDLANNTFGKYKSPERRDTEIKASSLVRKKTGSSSSTHHLPGAIQPWSGLSLERQRDVNAITTGQFEVSPLCVFKLFGFSPLCGW